MQAIWKNDDRCFLFSNVVLHRGQAYDIEINRITNGLAMVSVNGLAIRYSNLDKLNRDWQLEEENAPVDCSIVS